MALKGAVAGGRGDFAGVAGKAIATTGLTIGAATAVELTAGLVQRVEVSIQNLHTTNNLYVSDDTTFLPGSGIQVGPGELLSLAVTQDIIVYGLADGASTDVRVMEIR